MIGDKWEGAISIPEGESNDYKIRHIKRNGPVDAHTMRTLLYGQKKLTIPFEGETTWHEMSYDGGVWMTDLPVEQRQHDEEMKCMEGAERVLVGGLGLGYALHKLVRDYDVARVDVVEISQDVINLVWPHVASDVKARCVLHHADLSKYLDEHADCCDWDFGFYDIWQSDGEGTFHDMVVPLRQKSLECCEEVVCWNEDVMRNQLLQNLVSRFRMQQLYDTHKDKGLPKEFSPMLDDQKEVLLTADDKFIKWARLFWQAWFDGKIDEFSFNHAAVWYLQRYGRMSHEDFEHAFNAVIGNGAFAG